MQDAFGFIEALEQNPNAPAVVDAMGRVLGRFGVEKILIGGLSEQDLPDFRRAGERVHQVRSGGAPVQAVAATVRVASVRFR